MYDSQRAKSIGNTIMMMLMPNLKEQAFGIAVGTKSYDKLFAQKEPFKIVSAIEYCFPRSFFLYSFKLQNKNFLCNNH